MKTKQLPIKFSLVDIKTDQFAIFPEYHKPQKDTQLKTDFQILLHKEEYTLRLILGFTYEQQKKAFIKIETSCFFIIGKEDFEKCLNQQTKEIKFPKEFIGHLTMLSIGTIRGILFAKTEGSEFSKYILPTINVTEMIKNDVVFEMKEE